MSNPVNLLIIGSITKSSARYGENDIRERFGGGVMYGGKAATHLGIKTTIITVGALDIEGGMEELRGLGVNVKRIPRETSNNFSNDYSGKVRKVYMRSVIENPLTANEISQDAQGFNCVILFPLFYEISSQGLSVFSKEQLIFLDPTGFLRKKGEENEDHLYPVTPGDWKNMKDLPVRLIF